MATSAPALVIECADYADPRDAADLIALLDAYARDPMGGGEPLSDHARAHCVEGLAATPGAFSLIARRDGEAVALATCFTTFSTFIAAPLVNIHDFAVVRQAREEGIGRALMQAVEAEALKRGAAKLTLEVLSGNAPARALYAACGFSDYQLDPTAGQAMFWQKRL